MTSSVNVLGITPNIKVQGREQKYTYDATNQETTYKLQNEFDHLAENNMPSKNNLELSLKSGESFKWTVSQKKVSDTEQRAEYTFSYYRPDRLGHQYDPLVISAVTINDLTQNTHDGIIHFPLTVSMEGRGITNLHAPINQSDAVNKDYVDTQIANIGIQSGNSTSNSLNEEDVTEIIENREKKINPISGSLFSVHQISLPVSIDATNWHITGCQKGFVLWKSQRIFPDSNNNINGLNPSSYYIYYSPDGISPWTPIDLLDQSRFLNAVADAIQTYGRTTYIYMFTDGLDFYCFVKQLKDNELYPTSGAGQLNGTMFVFDTDDLEMAPLSFNLYNNASIVEPLNKNIVYNNISLTLISYTQSNNLNGSAVLKHYLSNNTWQLFALPETNIYNIFFDKTNWLFYAIGQNNIYKSTNGESWSTITIGGTQIAGDTHGANACITDEGTILIPKSKYFRWQVGDETLSNAFWASLDASAFFYAGNNVTGMLTKTPTDTQTATPGKHYVYLSRDEGTTWIKCAWLSNETSNLGRLETAKIGEDYQTIIYNGGASDTSRAYVVNFDHEAIIL